MIFFTTIGYIIVSEYKYDYQNLKYNLEKEIYMTLFNHLKFKGHVHYFQKVPTIILCFSI
jgi:hypothetical protein